MAEEFKGFKLFDVFKTINFEGLLGPETTSSFTHFIAKFVRLLQDTLLASRGISSRLAIVAT